MLNDKILKIGYSPDPDDAFMVYALEKGKVNLRGYELESVALDIQSLNDRALKKADLQVTAISAALYPLIADNYWVLSCGASVGRNYGPIVACKEKKTRAELRGKKIGVPGEYTTAFLLARFFLEDFVPVQLDFSAIIPAIQSGQIDAGVVIHEGQLNYARFGLEKCFDLGQCWFEEFELPIPLGLDVIHKSLGRENAVEIYESIYEAIVYAKKEPEEALKYARGFGRGIVGDSLKKFVAMYVSEDTLELGEEGKKALMTLFEEAYRRNLISDVPVIETIP